MATNASHPFQRHHAGGILGNLADGRGSFHNGHCRGEIAKSYKVRIKVGEKPELALAVLECFGKSKCALECNPNSIAATFGEHRRYFERLEENHFLLGASLRVTESGEGAFTPMPALLKQRQSNEQGGRRRGEVDADLRIAAVAKRPCKRCPHVANVWGIRREVMLAQRRLDNLV